MIMSVQWRSTSFKTTIMRRKLQVLWGDTSLSLILHSHTIPLSILLAAPVFPSLFPSHPPIHPPTVSLFHLYPIFLNNGNVKESISFCWFFRIKNSTDFSQVISETVVSHKKSEQQHCQKLPFLQAFSLSNWLFLLWSAFTVNKLGDKDPINPDNLSFNSLALQLDNFMQNVF